MATEPPDHPYQAPERQPPNLLMLLGMAVLALVIAVGVMLLTIL